MVMIMAKVLHGFTEKYVMAEDYVLIVIYGAATDNEPLLNSLHQ